MRETVGELVRRLENDYTRGNTQISKHVNFDMHGTLEKIDAYLNSKHVTGRTDSKGRVKPFFNISTAAVNIWYRATDIDRRHIRVKGNNTKNWINSFFATIWLRDWMRRERLGQFLNEWGRVLARYGSAVVKFVENSSGLHVYVVPWNVLIVDPVDFDANPKIEILELTEGQLRDRVRTMGYDAKQVDELCAARKSRETLDKQRKDNKSDYIKVYEIHGLLPKSYLTGVEGDQDTYVQQMHVVSFVGVRNGRKTEYKDFTLFSGPEAKDPYMITHLIKEDGRSLAIGAVEHLFEAQWQTNHATKAIKDTLDIASKIFFQTADPSLVGTNLLTDLIDGDIFIHKPSMPLTKVENSKPDIVSWQNYAAAWKNVGNEIVGVSEAMLGAQPKSGQAWRQTEALLTESYSLFELMTESKGLHIEDMMRERILPYARKQMDNADEIAATLEDYEINQIDSRFIKNEAIRRSNDAVRQLSITGEPITAEGFPQLLSDTETGVRNMLQSTGNQRIFKPSAVSWKEQFKDLEWDVEVDVTGEEFDTAEALTTLNTALKLMVTPGFDQNPRAQAVVSRILELTGSMSPIEYNSIPSPVQASPAPVADIREPQPASQDRNIRK